MNKRHPYRDMERKHITSDISLRELCRRNDITSHSVVSIRPRSSSGAEKREQYQAKASETFTSRYAAKMADRQARIHDKAIDAIDEAITKLRDDMRATKSVRQPDGTITEEPVMRLQPKDVVLLLDTFEVLFEKPSIISQYQGLEVSAEFTLEALREFIEGTRGRAGPSRVDVPPLPRTRRLDD